MDIKWRNPKVKDDGSTFSKAYKIYGRIKFVIFCIIFVIIFGLVALAMFSGKGQVTHSYVNVPLLIIPVIIIAGTIALIIYTRKKNKELEIRKKAMEALLPQLSNEVFGATDFNANVGMSEQNFDYIECLVRDNGFKSLNSFSWQLSGGGTGYFCEIEDAPEKLIDSMGNTVYRNERDVAQMIRDRSVSMPFDGSILMFNFPKHITSTVFAYSQEKTWKPQIIGPNNHNISTASIFFKHPLQDRGLETENVNFNQKFQIRGTDSEELFYILTPQLMEKMLEALQYTPNGALYTFKDNIVCIALPFLHLSHPGINLSQSKGANKKMSFKGTKKSIDEIATEIRNTLLSFNQIADIIGVNFNNMSNMQAQAQPAPVQEQISGGTNIYNNTNQPQYADNTTAQQQDYYQYNEGAQPPTATQQPETQTNSTKPKFNIRGI